MEQPSFEKFSITLPAEMARIIRERVSSGHYGSATEVIREAMRAWLGYQRRLGALDAAIGQGVADAEVGRVQSIDDVQKEMQARFGTKGPAGS